MISIIIPVYNVEKYLDKCLNSLVNQTSNNFEVIIVNDGTKDNSQIIIDKYVKENHNFYSYIKENGGLADARNYGLSKATKEYIMFIDSDDYVNSDLIEECEKKLELADLIIFEYNQIDLRNNKIEIITNKFIEDKIYTLSEYPNLINNISNCAWNKIYHRRLFNNIKYPIGYLYEDLGTTYKIINEAKKITFINKPLVNYLLNREGNITTTIDNRLFDIFVMCDEIINYYKEKDLFEKYKYQLELLSWINIVECLRKLPKNVSKEFSDKFINKSFNYIDHNFGKKTVSLANSFISNVYEYKFLCK